MPSFDVVSELDMHEVTNAIDQANREVSNRFDFKGTNSRFERIEHTVTMISQSDFQLKQMLEMLQMRLAKRGIDIACMQIAEPVVLGQEARQTVTLREGIDSDLARKLVKLIKEKKLKVQAAVQGDKVRVTGKKRDDLQTVIGALKEADVELPLQYVNFRD